MRGELFHDELCRWWIVPRWIVRGELCAVNCRRAPRLWQNFLEFKNIISKKNCPINSKTVIKNFSHVRLPYKSLNFMVLGYSRKKSQNHGKYAWKFFMITCWKKFLPKLCFLNPRTLFRAWDQSIPWERTWKFPGISYLTDLRRTRGAKKIHKTVLKTRLRTKETTYTLVFKKYLVVSFRSHSIKAFSVFLEDSLKIIPGVFS
jgi:hypothetical protein